MQNVDWARLCRYKFIWKKHVRVVYNTEYTSIVYYIRTQLGVLLDVENNNRIGSESLNVLVL